MISFSILSILIIFILTKRQTRLDLIYSPAIFPLFFIFSTYIISPILYHFDISVYKLWLKNYNQHFFTVNYQVLALFIIFLIFLVFGVNYKLRKRKITVPRLGLLKSSGQLFLFISILVLIPLINISDYFMFEFDRSKAIEIINVEGFGKQLLFIPVLTISLIFILKDKANTWKKIFGYIIIYIALIPFFAITSGRGTLLFPLILIIFTFIVGIKRIPKVFLLPIVIGSMLLVVWLGSLRMNETLDTSVDNGSSMALISISDTFSRFDSTYAGLSTLVNEDWPLLFGSTYFYGLFQVFPPSIIDLRDKTVTQYLAKAIHNDKELDIPSGIASSLIFESYANFGVLGIIFFGFLSGQYLALIVAFYHSKIFEYRVLATVLAWINPLTYSFALYFYDIVYKIFFPIALLYFGSAFFAYYKGKNEDNSLS